MHHLSDLNSKKAWTELGDKDKRMLEGGGIKEDDWTILQQVDRTEALGGERLITNKDIFNIPDDQILQHHSFNPDGFTPAQLIDEAFKLKEQLANKYMNYIYTETNASVLEVGARENTLMSIGTEKGTIGNELLRFFWQFKQFPFAMLTRMWYRGMSQGTPQAKFIYLAKLFAYTTLMGGLVAQIQNITKGQDLDDPTTMDFFLKSIVKGGSASFLADAVSATADPTDRSFKDWIIPAAFKDVGNVATMVSGAGQHYLEERESSYGAEAVNTIKNNTPFQNVWYTRLVFDRIVIAELQDMFDEGYRDRKQYRLESKHNQGFWWDLDNEEVRLPEINNLEDNK